jgi:hypothetical protein
VDTNIQGWGVAAALYGMLKRTPYRHQRSRGDDPLPVRPDDAFVDAWRYAEIVGVNDQPEGGREGGESRTG